MPSLVLNCNIAALCSEVSNKKILLQSITENQLRYGVSHQRFTIIVCCGNRDNKYNP